MSSNGYAKNTRTVVTENELVLYTDVKANYFKLYIENERYTARPFFHMRAKVLNKICTLFPVFQNAAIDGYVYRLGSFLY
jgi:hypothetical protein